MESLRMLMGGTIKEASTSESVKVYRTAEGTVATAGSSSTAATFTVFTDTATGKKYNLVASGESAENPIIPSDANPISMLNLSKGKRYIITNATTDPDLRSDTFAVGDRIRIFWTETRTGTSAGSNAVEIAINPGTFPGTLDYDRAS